MSADKTPKCKNMMYTQQITHLPPGIATTNDLAAQIETKLQPKEAFWDLLYIGAITKAEIEEQLTGAQYAKYHRQIADVDAKRLMREAEKWRLEMSEKGAEITVIWITGPGGTGKTSLAKEYAKKRGQSYFITGSSRDIFQNYNGEHTLIIDELRRNFIPASLIFTACRVIVRTVNGSFFGELP